MRCGFMTKFSILTRLMTSQRGCVNDWRIGVNRRPKS